jgi:hypothetical protein
MTKEEKRKKHREYMRKYYERNFAAQGIHKLGRPAKAKAKQK